MQPQSARALLLPLVAALALAAAGKSAALEFRTGEAVTAQGGFNDSLFLAGREVVMSLSNSDDVFAAGRTVQARVVRADHLLMAGRSLGFAGGEAHDVIAAGEEARFESGRVGDDLIAFGRKLTLLPGFSLGGSAVLSGAEVDVSAPVGGALAASGATVRLNAPVRGGARITADRLVLGPQARIGGDLIYRARQTEISPEAVISGRTLATRRDAAAGPGTVLGAAAAGFLFFALGGAVLTLAAVALFPGLMDQTAGRLDQRPVVSLGLGVLLLLAGPLLAVLLLLSLVGAPLGLFVVALYVATAPLALAAVVNWLGLKARRLSRRGAPTDGIGAWARLGWSLLAAVALIVLAWIPLVGGLAWLLAYVAGVGAVAAEGRRALARA